MSERTGASIHVTGVVQGVGFRPFVYGLARRLHLNGWVCNTSAGVDIVIDGLPQAVSAFTAALQSERPPLARIDGVTVSELPANGYSDFKIVPSQPRAGAFQPVAADVALCADCRHELFDPADRRYRYPFINCTNCGPRFTIIDDIPYDRPATTMAPFAMCAACAAEYEDPGNRRFHAQPVACPHCGPQIWLEAGGRATHRGEGAIAAARRLLAKGAIVAVKGLGGCHLACDATCAGAVDRLRQRKRRPDKPFAVMMADFTTVERHCRASQAERALLWSAARPIVLLERRPQSPVVDAVAPGLTILGVMLPYTPLHELLLESEACFPSVLVMTSGNASDEPIVCDNDEARERLVGLADAILLHDRAIQSRCDDSVVRIAGAAEENGGMAAAAAAVAYPLRRSRGYAPLPVALPWPAPPLLATGAELKNTFCVTRQEYAFVSQHIGDLENYESLRAFEASIAHFERLFRVRPQALAYDLHPDYLASRYALERAEREELPALPVLHHHAHIAACMAEHRLTGEQPVIGVAFDGAGYGEDGAIWGGEFLLADYLSCRRLAHLEYMPLAGGDEAVRRPWRLALAWLWQAGLPWKGDLAPVLATTEQERIILRRQLERGLNTFPTSSMGRLFDAVSALIGVRQLIHYEGQAAVELEHVVDRSERGRYPMWQQAGVIQVQPLMRAIIRDLLTGYSPATIAARFHNSIAALVAQQCGHIRDETGVTEVALSGGVWQNMLLLQRTRERLLQAGFTTYIHQQVPCNDGGLALGQAVVAAAHLQTASPQPARQVSREKQCA